MRRIRSNGVSQPRAIFSKQSATRLSVLPGFWHGNRQKGWRRSARRSKKESSNTRKEMNSSYRWRHTSWLCRKGKWNHLSPSEKPIHLYNRAAAAGAGAGGATETMIACHDLPVVDFIWIHIPQEDRRTIFPLHPELLIEITIVNFSTPAHADGVAAHQAIDRCRVKRLN